MSKQKLDKISTQVLWLNREQGVNLATTSEWATIHGLDLSMNGSRQPVIWG